MPEWGVSGAPSFNLQDCKIGTWDGDGTYTGLVDVPSVQLLNVEMEVTSERLEGDSKITDQATVTVAGKGRVRFGSVGLEVLEKLTGRTLQSSGSTPNRVTRMKFTAEEMQYFGICGRSAKTPQGGNTLIFAPKCIITEGFSVQMEYNKYVVPEISFTALADFYYQLDGTSEIQTVTISGTPTGGTFTLSFRGQTTSALAYNAAAATVQTALRALSTIGSAGVTVSGSAGGPYTVTFADDLAETAIELMTASGSGLTGGSSPAVAVTEATPGVDFEETIFEIIEYETAVAIQLPPP